MIRVKSSLKIKKFRTKGWGIAYVEWTLSLDVSKSKQSEPYECIHQYHKLPAGTITRARRGFRRSERASMMGVLESQEKYSPILPSPALLPERTVHELKIIKVRG